MKDRYWLTQHRSVFYALDSETRKKQSLRTRNKSEARRLLAAKNESARQPQLNLALAKAYLSAHDPRIRKDRRQHFLEVRIEPIQLRGHM